MVMLPGAVRGFLLAREAQLEKHNMYLTSTTLSLCLTHTRGREVEEKAQGNKVEEGGEATTENDCRLTVLVGSGGMLWCVEDAMSFYMCNHAVMGVGTRNRREPRKQIR